MPLDITKPAVVAWQTQNYGVQGQGYAMRSYSGGVVIVNPAASGSASVSVSLPAGESFDDLYGNAVTSPVSLAASSGLVLVVKGPPRC